MKTYRADLHIHTLLSPCGDLSMSPANIITEAGRKGLDIIGITDHNSTRHCRLISRLGAEKGIFVMMGAEVNTKEEIHCLAFFENNDTLDIFQEYLDANLPDFKNDPFIFGDQIVVDENEDIIYTEDKLLINAVRISIEELEAFVHSNNGIFIPAHIDRMKNSIYSQLGFLPENLNPDALEISRKNSPGRFAEEHPEIYPFTLLTNSDAHYSGNIGAVFNSFCLKEPSFNEIRMALQGSNNRKIIDQ
jgi:PHP family Zn ribbon phosphoesterase